MTNIATQVADKLLGIDLTRNTRTILDVSTAMIPKHTADALDRDKALKDFLSAWSLDMGNGGWLVFSYFDSGHPGVHELQPKHPELFKLMDFAYERDYVYVQLDPDAQELPAECGLPTFDW